MKGLDDMTVRATEERVRDAFGAAAETVTARDLPGPPTAAGHTRAARSRAHPGSSPVSQKIRGGRARGPPW